MKAKFLKNKKFILVAVLTVMFFVFPLCSWAGPVDWAVTQAVGGIAGILITVCGWILTSTINMIVSITKYNNFIDEPTIVSAWVIIRDFCNMFFILVLLIIAFATILRLENYSMKKFLPKLLLMAVLINFSRTICGVLIDLSQIVMLTFVNAFSDGGGNFVNMLRVNEYITLAEESADFWGTGNNELNLTNTVAAMVVAIIFLLIATIAMAALLLVFLMRMIMLWIYVVLSPLGFFMSAVPGGQKYSGQYWGEFTRYLVNGPVLAFFIWLALMTIQNAEQFNNENFFDSTDKGTVVVGVTEILTDESFISFIIAIGMLVGGLMISSQLGGAGASWGSSMVNKLSSKGMGFVKGGGKLLSKGTVGGLDWINRKQAAKTGFDLNMPRNFAKIKAGLEDIKKKDLRKMDWAADRNLAKGGFTAAIGGIGATGWAEHHVRGFLGGRGFESALFGGKKRINDMRKEADDYRWKADNSFANKEEFDKKIIEKEEAISYAQRDGNTEEVKKLTDDIVELNKHQGDIIGPTKRAEYLKKVETIEKKINRRKPEDYLTAKTQRASFAEENKNITSTNEDELVAQFAGAQAKNNAPLAGAIALALAKVGGGNALLAKYGYHAKGGFTEEEKEKLLKTEEGRERYENSKGFNDFVRDVLIGKMGMDEQTALRLQNDMAGIGENVNHSYLKKTVNVDDNGKLIQVKSDLREKMILVEDLKREGEKGIRNANRLDYGGENVNKAEGHNFEWSDSGLAKFIANIDLVAKESMYLKRFNKSAARAITQPEALQKLKDRLKELNITTYEDNKTGKAEDINNFLEKFKQYGESSQDENLSNLLRSEKIV